MAYTVGVLCRSPMSVNLVAVLDDLVSHASIIRSGPRSEGEGWCACDVQLGQSQWMATLPVSRVAKHLTTLVDSAAADGFALEGFQPRGGLRVVVCAEPAQDVFDG